MGFGFYLPNSCPIFRLITLMSLISPLPSGLEWGKSSILWGVLKLP